MAKISMSSVQGQLPSGWCRPSKNDQPTLFPHATDEVLQSLDVSRGDMRRWRELGWVSFDVDAAPQLDEPEVCEISFVRNIARSGLSISQINECLAGLPKPYRYDPTNTTYHFAHGWVVPQPEEPFEVVDREIDAWIDHLATEGEEDRLRELSEQIAQHIGLPEGGDQEKT